MGNLWRNHKIRHNIRKEYGPKLGDEVFEMPVDSLSEKQKYQLVYSRVMLQNPQIVFCIRPFKGADLTHRMVIWKLLEEFLEKRNYGGRPFTESLRFSVSGRQVFADSDERMCA